MLYQKKLFIIAVVSSILGGIPTFAQYVSPSMPEVVDEYALGGNQLYVSDELIVKFKPTKVNLESSRGMMVMNTFADVQGIAVEETIVDANITVFSVDSDEDLFQKIQELEANPNVEYAQPNFIYNIQSYQPNDTHFSLQRGLQNIGQNIGGSIGTSGADIKRTQAMDIRSGNQNISTTGTVVAIIDDGLWYTHPDLSGQLRDGNTCVSATGSPLGGCLFGYDFFAMDKDPTPHGTDTHGTHVAGIVGAKTNNSIGVVGTNPGAKIMALRAASGNALTTSVIVQAIAFAQRNGAKIINASWGGGASSCATVDDTILHDAIKNFSGLFVTAAGNTGKNHLDGWFSIPADFNTDTECRSGLDNIIAVAASTNTDTLASFSDYGANIQIAAPGVHIYSLYNGSQYEYMNGTSMSTPYVAGAVSLARNFRPDLSYQEIKNSILDSAEYIPALSGYVASGKRLDIYATLYALDNYAPVAPLLLTPGSGSDINSGLIQFTWTASVDVGVGISGYYVEISTGSDFIQPYSGTYIFTTGYDISLTETGTYYRRVYAFDAKDNTGEWSQVSVFSISESPDTTPPSIPTLITPSSGSSYSRGNISFLWTPSVDTGVGHRGYEYEISGGEILSGTIFTTGGIINLDSGEYTRRVRVYDYNLNYSEYTPWVPFFILWDTTPETIQIVPRTNAELSTLYTSDSITLSGINTGILISVNTGMYQINGGSWQTTSNTGYQGDTIQLALTSAVSYSTAKSMMISVGSGTATYTITTKSAPTSPGGGDKPPPIPTCTSIHLVCSGGIYVLKPGIDCQGGNMDKVCTISVDTGIQDISTGIYILNTDKAGDILYSPFSEELNRAYMYAYEIGITTIPTIIQANMTGTLIRKHLAKMISNFAINQLAKTPDTSIKCDFIDMINEATEMQFYAKLACQLGVMGLDANGVPVKKFNPDAEVTRAQFGTVLSRTLRGSLYNGSEPYYFSHLDALQKEGIMKSIDVPENKELRGWVMLMLMRATE